MISFAAFVPHSPLLIDSIGKENTAKLAQTRAAMARVAEEIYVAQTQTLLMISLHGSAHPDIFSVHVHDPLITDFHEFGDFSTHAAFHPDLGLITDIQRRMMRETIPFTLDSHPALDYGTGVPLTLFHFSPHAPKLVSVLYSHLDAKTHVAFGRILEDVCSSSPVRIAVIASGDLSHALSTDAPAGYDPEGERFDAAMMQSLEQPSLSHALALSSETISRASACAYQPILILLGMLEHLQMRTEILSYEHPFGVGQLVAAFHI